MSEVVIRVSDVSKRFRIDAGQAREIRWQACHSDCGGSIGPASDECHRQRDGAFFFESSEREFSSEVLQLALLCWRSLHPASLAASDSSPGDIA